MCVQVGRWSGACLTHIVTPHSVAGFSSSMDNARCPVGLTLAKVGWPLMSLCNRCTESMHSCRGGVAPPYHPTPKTMCTAEPWPWTHFSHAEILALARGVIPPAPAVPASTRIPASLKHVQEHSSHLAVNVQGPPRVCVCAAADSLGGDSKTVMIVAVGYAFAYKPLHTTELQTKH